MLRPPPSRGATRRTVTARSSSSRSFSIRISESSTAELRQLFRHALCGFFGVLNGMTQRGRHVQRRKHFRPRGFDVALEPFDVPVLFGVLVLDPLQLAGRMLLILPGACRGVAALRQQQASRLAPRLERRKLCTHFFGARSERGNLLAVELNLLLPPVDVELAGVHRLACARRACLRLRRARCGCG